MGLLDRMKGWRQGSELEASAVPALTLKERLREPEFADLLRRRAYGEIERRLSAGGVKTTWGEIVAVAKELKGDG